MRVRMRLQRILIAAVAVPALSLGISAPALAKDAGTARPVPAVQRHDQHKSALAVDPWGSIAYSPQRQHWGYSYGYPTQTQARIAALGYCASGGTPGCQEAVSYQNSWGALAIGSNGAWGSGRGDYYGARYYALTVCINNRGINCTVRLTVHS